MRVIRYFVLLLARSFQAVGGLFSRFTDLFNGLLPALFSPPELTRLLQKHYARLYSDGFVKEPHDLIDYLERWRSEEHTSELQSRLHLVCRLLLEKKKKRRSYYLDS